LPLGLIDFRNSLFNYLFVLSKIENMKKLTNCVSPFIMLLVPLFLLIGLLLTNINNEIPVEKQSAGLKLKMPSIRSLVSNVIK
jgi:hypothetical protein